MAQIRFAEKQDVDNVIQFLGQVQMQDTRISSIYSQFMLLEHESKLQAVIGYERADTAALLRSLVVAPDVNQMELLQFLQTFLEQVHERGMDDLYLVTSSKNAVPLFRLFGFTPVDKRRVADGIASLEHFASSIERKNSFVLNCQLFTRISTD